MLNYPIMKPEDKVVRSWNIRLWFRRDVGLHAAKHRQHGEAFGGGTGVPKMKLNPKDAAGSVDVLSRKKEVEPHKDG